MAIDWPCNSQFNELELIQAKTKNNSMIQWLNCADLFHFQVSPLYQLELTIQHSTYIIDTTWISLNYPFNNFTRQPFNHLAYLIFPIFNNFFFKLRKSSKLFLESCFRLFKINVSDFKWIIFILIFILKLTEIILTNSKIIRIGIYSLVKFLLFHCVPMFGFGQFVFSWILFWLSWLVQLPLQLAMFLFGFYSIIYSR